MGIRDVLLGISTTYDANARTDRGVPGQDLLRQAPTLLADSVPAGLVIKASGGQGTATFTPWIGFFDPRETVSSHEGLYLVYIFAMDMRSVYLFLNQGVTALKEEYGIGGALSRLEREALTLLAALPKNMVEPWQDKVDLRTPGNSWRQRAYEAGCVVSREYTLDALPSEAELRANLRDMTDVFRASIQLKRSHIPLSEPSTRDRETAINISSNSAPTAARPEGFRPKDSSEYVVYVKGQELTKGRFHELLIADFVEHSTGLGFTPASEGAHPRDLVLYREDQEWLVEAKFIANKDIRGAVRGALSQLFEYRFCLYDKNARPHLVGLFSEFVGELFRDFLEENDIAAVWRDGDGWAGSPLAQQWGLVTS